MKRIATRVLMIAIGIQCMAQLKSGPGIAEATTDNGDVRGYISNDIYTFKGIPYGTANRFEDAAKPEPWEGVRSSMTWGPVAPLITPTSSVNDEIEFVFNHDWGYTNEDCLVLNVWTPGLNDGKKRPVMFWIHGGGFTAGSSQELPSYHGENLAKKGDVVVVSINHRLNILGFLDLSAYGEKYINSANQSILDMKLALEWVQNNITNFGGDPENVMIFGQSGGGAKVNTLMAMPSASGLFHKAVNQSGSFRMNILEKEQTQAIGAEVLKELDLTADEVDSLQNVPFEKLAAAGQKALQVVQEQMAEAGQPVPGFGLNWGPSRDGSVLPYQLFSQEAYELSRDIPLLIGTVKNEFMISMQMGGSVTMEQVKSMLGAQLGDRVDEYIAAVQKAFPEDNNPADIIDVDMLFRPGAVQQANDKADLKNGAPVYMYYFSWQSPTVGGRYKAMHCMELPFVFNNIDKCAEMTGGTPEAYALADKVSNAWINFARSGDPNHEGLPVWPAYTSRKGATMFFDVTCEIRNHHDKEVLAIRNSGN